MAGTPRLAPMSKLVPAGSRTTRSAGRFVYSCAVPVGRWWPARNTQTRSPVKVRHPLAHCVDDTGTVLVRGHLRERRGGAVAGAQARLPVGGVDTRDSDAHTDLAGLRVRYIAINEAQN